MTDKRVHVTWLCLGEVWGVVRDVRKKIYSLLTPLERVMVERAHGVDTAFAKYKNRVCSWAAQEGYLALLQWARANGCPWKEDTCERAAEGGHLELLKWARANRCPWNTRTCAFAARGGHLDILQWARADGCPWNKKKVARVQQEKGS